MTARARRTTAAVLAVVVGGGLVATVPAAPASAATPVDGPLLTTTSLVDAAGVATALPSGVMLRGREFSPDGTMIAGTAGDGTVLVWTNTGSERQLAKLDGEVSAITWSPDQTQLAVLVDNPTDADDGTIYRVVVSSGATSQIVDSSSALHIADLSNGGVSWSPTSDTIAFIAGEPAPEGGYYDALDYGQVYTVPAAGGAWSRYNQHRAECLGADCASYEYADPAWAPDGTKVAALVTKHVDGVGGDPERWTDEQFVGTITAGATDPVKIFRASIYDDSVSSYSHLGNGPLIWSADGTKLLFALAPSENDFHRTPTVIDVATGTVASTFKTTALFYDWQPCPTGTCASWAQAPRAATKLKGLLPTATWPRKLPPSVTGTLTVTPQAYATGPISVLIDGKQVKSGTLTAAMRNRFSFKLPVLKAGKHTIQLRYGGSSKEMPSATGVAGIVVQP